MATLILLKRKNSAGNNGVVLAAGEAYYNLHDKRFYIGNNDNDDTSNADKKHIAQITPLNAGSNVIKFQIGEDPQNIYVKELSIPSGGVAVTTTWRSYESIPSDLVNPAESGYVWKSY